MLTYLVVIIGIVFLVWHIYTVVIFYLLFSLFGLMLKKHNRLVDQLRHNAMLNNMSKDSGSENETDYVSTLVVIKPDIYMQSAYSLVI